MTLLGSASPLAQSRRGQGWSMLLALALASVTLATPSCQGAARPRSGTKVAHQPAHASRARHAAHARTPRASAARGASPIAPETRAPQPAGAPDPALDSLLRHCG